MKISKQSRRDAKTLLNACRVNGVLDEQKVRTAVTQLVALKPRGYAGTLDRLKRLVKLDLDRRSAVIESAVALDSNTQQAVQARLSQMHGAGLSFAFRTNPALVGGIRVRVGSDIYDGSIAGRLAALESSF